MIMSITAHQNSYISLKISGFMKKYLFLLAIVLSSHNLSQGQTRNLQALFSYKTFYSPENGPYVESYLSVNANSVHYVKLENGNYQGSIEISIQMKNSDGLTKYHDKYNLLSPEVNDIEKINFSFVDQQRIPLTNGDYTLELTIADKNTDKPPYSVRQPVKVEYYSNILSISDIELVDNYSKTESPSVISKSGLDVVPFVDNYYPQSMTHLRFYAEIYNADKILNSDPYLVTYYFETSESKQVIEKLKGFTKKVPEKVSVLVREIPIDELPSGNYNLIIELRNQQNELLATKSTFIQRNNPMIVEASENYSDRDVSNTFAGFITDKDSLKEYINSLQPIASPLEMLFLTNQMKIADVTLMQRFFYDFWISRNPSNPEKSWLDYHEEVLKVNQQFGTRITPGYATDRGRVYLQYGPPNSMNPYYNEPSAYPYEVWHYYKLENQSNRKFVFYNPDLITNDFKLLHSDAKGEFYNARWELDLHKRDTQSINLDKEDKGNNTYFGNQADDNFNNPR